MLALSYIPVWNIVPQGGFTQTLFASPTQQPLVLNPKYEALAGATPPSDIWQAFVVGTGAAACAPASRLISALRGYDYVIFVDREISAFAITRSFSQWSMGATCRFSGSCLVHQKLDRQAASPMLHLGNNDLAERSGSHSVPHSYRRA